MLVLKWLNSPSIHDVHSYRSDTYSTLAQVGLGPSTCSANPRCIYCHMSVVIRPNVYRTVALHFDCLCIVSLSKVEVCRGTDNSPSQNLDRHPILSTSYLTPHLNCSPYKRGVFYWLHA